MSGPIHIVGTPIGNLEDITLRGLRTLREADVIACEDTRHTRKLLTHYDIQKPLVSCHEHNELQRVGELIRRARSGESVAFVTDAGMPTISDPGYRLVSAAIEQGVEVRVVPGPTAVESAIAISGLPSSSFRFIGFLPAKRGQRKKTLAALAADRATIVCYETPHRILAALEDIQAELGDRPVTLAREMTKMHEEILRDDVSKVLAELNQRDRVRGEITLVIGPSAETATPDVDIPQRVADLIESGRDRMEAIKMAASEAGLSKREAYSLLEDEK